MKKENKEIRKVVKEGYAKIAKQGISCCPSGSCCGNASAQVISKSIGYSDAEMKIVPEGDNIGLGCGNPVAIARVFGVKKALVYVPSIVVLGTIVGWFFGNFIF